MHPPMRPSFHPSPNLLASFSPAFHPPFQKKPFPLLSSFSLLSLTFQTYLFLSLFPPPFPPSPPPPGHGWRAS